MHPEYNSALDSQIQRHQSVLVKFLFASTKNDFTRINLRIKIRVEQSTKKVMYAKTPLSDRDKQQETKH